MGSTTRSSSPTPSPPSDPAWAETASVASASAAAAAAADGAEGEAVERAAPAVVVLRGGPNETELSPRGSRLSSGAAARRSGGGGGGGGSGGGGGNGEGAAWRRRPPLWRAPRAELGGRVVAAAVGYRCSVYGANTSVFIKYTI